MAKFSGIIGFSCVDEKAPYEWGERVIERHYRGDVFRDNRRTENGEHLNDNIRLNNVISIVADDYAYNHSFAIRYVTLQNSKWKVTNVEVSRPRLILTIGGVYNGPDPERKA